MKASSQASSILAPDDLRVGSYVAIHSSVPSQTPADAEPERRGHARFRPENPAPMAGIPLQIRGVSLPFLACAILGPGGTYSGPVIIDLRTVRLIRLSRQFIGAIRRFPAQTSVDITSGLELPTEVTPHRGTPDPSV